MCGACGERATVDWARPLFANLAARAAGANAVLRLVTRPGVRVQPRSGGWLVTGPTGRATVCGGLSELVAAVRPWGPAVPALADGAPGRLSVPPGPGRNFAVHPSAAKVTGETITGNAADVVVWLEWARQAGVFDDRAVTARCALDDDHELEIHVTAGHVVRAKVVSEEQG